MRLFYLAGDGALTIIPVESQGATWSVGTATRPIERRYYTAAISRQYDVSADGQRFVMIKDGGGTGPLATPPQIIVVQHWSDEGGSYAAGLTPTTRPASTVVGPRAI